MAASLVITVKTGRSDASALAVDSSLDTEGMIGLINYLQACVGGHESAAVDVQYTDSVAPVAASATITLESCATDTVTIGGVTFTGAAEPSGDEEFETDGDDTADAAALAAKINAHPTVSKAVVATSAAGVVTVTCRVKGVVGNLITLAKTGTTITLSDATLTDGTGGAQSTAKTYSCGL